MKGHKHLIVTILVVYLIMSFVPQLGLMSIISKKGGGGKGKKGG